MFKYLLIIFVSITINNSLPYTVNQLGVACQVCVDIDGGKVCKYFPMCPVGK